MRKRSQSASGFTLVEMLAVIGIMVILMAAAAPMFFSMAKSAAMRGAVSQVRSTLSLARQYAISQNEVVYFIIADHQSGTYSINDVDKCLRAFAVYSVGPDSDPAVSTDDYYLKEWEYLPSGVVFDILEPDVRDIDDNTKNLNIFAYKAKADQLRFPSKATAPSMNFRYIKFRGDGRASFADVLNGTTTKVTTSSRAIIVAEGGTTWKSGAALSASSEEQYFIPPTSNKKAVLVAQRSGRIEIRDVP